MYPRPPTLHTGFLHGWKMTRVTYGGPKILDSVQEASTQLGGQSPSTGHQRWKAEREGPPGTEPQGTNRYNACRDQGCKITSSASYILYDFGFTHTHTHTL